MIITFCGHADFQKTKEYEQKILTFLDKTVGTQSADMYLGGYGNFDQFAFECCQKYKKTHSNISLIFVTPYLSIEYQKRFLEYKQPNYDLIIYPEIENKPPKFAILYRNRWMIEQSDFVVCGIDHAWGGAYKTYQYAKQKKKSILNITDKTF